MSSLLTALIMGLAGSLHCAGMCSPLAFALTKSKPFLRSGILYNSGRVLVYALLGGLASSFGSILHLAPYQKILSILLGIVFLLAGFGITNMRIPYIGSALTRFTSLLKNIFSALLTKKSWTSTFLLGMMNGLLPCGLTYMALSACLILPQATDGFLFMIFFGMGTWPVMIGLSKLLSEIKWKRNFSLTRFSKVAMIFIGCLLLLRTWWHPHEDIQIAKSVQQIVICK
ncbi:MAG: sulfite exporter TauE/SafE family protein [Cyclobacteriaceae bacterium]